MVDLLFIGFLFALAIVAHLAVWAVAMAGIRARARRDLTSGELILEYGWGAKSLALFLLAIPTVATLGLTKGLTDLQGVDWGFILVFFGIFLSFAGPGLIEFFGVSHRLTPQGIRKGSPWSRKFFARWDEIRGISYSLSFDGFVLQTPRGKIRVSRYLSGLEDFVLAIWRNVPENLWPGADARVIQRIGAGGHVRIRLIEPSWEGTKQGVFEGQIRRALSLANGLRALVVRGDSPQDIHRKDSVLDVIVVGLDEDVFRGLLGKAARTERRPVPVGIWRLDAGWLWRVDGTAGIGADPPSVPESGYLGRGEIRLVGEPPTLQGN